MSLTNYNEAHSQFEDIKQLADKIEETNKEQNGELEQLDGEQIIDLMGGGYNRYQLLYMLVFGMVWMIDAIGLLSPPILFQHIDLKCYDSQSNKYYKCNEINGGCQQPVIEPFDDTYNTMTFHFKLYCDKSYMRKYGLIAPFLGALLGVPIMSYIADIYGRKISIYLGHLVLTIVSILIPLVEEPHFQIVNSFFLSFLAYGIGIVQVTYINETSAAKPRSNIICFLCIVYPAGSMVYALVFEIYKDWKTTNIIIITVPCLIGCLQFLFIEETPLYLFEKQKEQELMQVINNIAKINGRQHLVKPKYKFKFVQTQEQQNQYSYIDLFRFPKLRTTLISCIFVSIAGYYTYNGVNLCLEKIGFDIYSNMIVVQAGHLIGQITCILIAASVKRKRLIQIVLFCTFLLNFVQLYPHLALKNSGSQQDYLKYIQISLAFLAKLIGCTGSCLLFVYYTELFPTEIKSQASGLIISIGLLSVTAIPFIVDFAYVRQMSALFLISSVSLIGFIFSFFLTETLNKPLLHKIEQFENRFDSTNKQNDNNQSKDPTTQKDNVQTQIEEDKQLLQNK